MTTPGEARTNYITIEIEGSNYFDVVPMHVQIDPDFEELVYGDDLKDGMVVLLEPRLRQSERTGAYNYDELIVKNRWCTVTRFRADAQPVEVYPEPPAPEAYSALRYGFPRAGTGFNQKFKLKDVEQYKNTPLEEIPLEQHIRPKDHLRAYDDAEEFDFASPMSGVVKYPRMVMKTKLAFIGVYGDGIKTVREVNATDGWLVKKDSIPV